MFYNFGALFSFDFCLCSSEVIVDIGVLCTILVVVSHAHTSITIKTETPQTTINQKNPLQLLTPVSTLRPTVQEIENFIMCLWPSTNDYNQVSTS